MPFPLKIHVFGGAVGESIVLELPNARWALIDVYLSQSNSAQTLDPIVSLLERNNVSELEFLCVTHPHYDHVKGVRYIIENFKVRRFLGFGALPPQLLYNQIVKVLKAKAKRLHDNARENELASELLDALATVNERVKKRQLVHDPVVVNAVVLNEMVGQEKIPLRMIAIAPSGRSVTAYNEQLCACFDKSDSKKLLADRLDGVDHNEISSAFVLEYGTQRIVLGGDVEAPGWMDVIARPPPVSDLRADLVKVSHHGSENAYFSGLWENHLSPNSCATAVVTAFASKRLPRPAGVGHIRSTTKRLVTTSVSSIEPRMLTGGISSPFAGLPADAQAALVSIFKNVSKAPNSRGVCSFAFDGASLMSEDLSGDAGAL